MKDLEREIFICQCHSLEHQISFWYDKYQNDLYCEPHLSTHRGFWGRVKIAIRYIFGCKKGKYGAWDEIILKKDDVKKLNKSLKKIIKNNKNNEE